MLNLDKYILILILSIFYLTIAIIAGCYYESYEAIFASLSKGIYTSAPILDLNMDFQIGLLPFYSLIDQHIQNIQFYGITLMVLGYISYINLGITILYTYKNENTSIYEKTINTTLYLLISIPNIVYLSATRSIFILMFNLFLKDYITKFKITKTTYFLIIFSIATRVDAVLLSSIIFLTINYIYKKSISKIGLITLVLSLTTWVFYQILINNNTSEAKYCFYNYELEIFDKNNYNINKLNKDQIIKIKNIRENLIFDNYAFNIEFYKSIIKNSENNTFNKIKNTALTTFNDSKWLVYLWFILLLYQLILTWLKKDNLKSIILCILPLPIITFAVIPPRFIYPFLLFLFVISYHKSKRMGEKTILLSIFLILTSLDLFTFIANSKEQNKKFLNKQLFYKNIESNNNKIFYSENFDFESDFPRSPFNKIEKRRIRFLNFYYFMSLEAYQKQIKMDCNCNPLSIESKINYIVNSKTPLIVEYNRFHLIDEIYKPLLQNKNINLNFVIYNQN